MLQLRVALEKRGPATHSPRSLWVLSDGVPKHLSPSRGYTWGSSTPPDSTFFPERLSQRPPHLGGGQALRQIEAGGILWDAGLGEEIRAELGCLLVLARQARHALAVLLHHDARF